VIQAMMMDGINIVTNPLPLKTIFRQVENSVVQITSKIPTTGVFNPQNPQSMKKPPLTVPAKGARSVAMIIYVLPLFHIESTSPSYEY
jgi:hypothetical protein